MLEAGDAGRLFWGVSGDWGYSRRRGFLVMRDVSRVGVEQRLHDGFC